MTQKYSEQAELITQLCNEAGLTPAQMATRAAVKAESMRKIIKGYQACSPQLLQSFRLIADMEIMRKSKPDGPVPRNHGGPYWGTKKEAPIISWTSAGPGGAYEDQGTDVPHIGTDCTDPNCYALEIVGDSMEPIYREGDIVVVAPNSEARAGDLVIAKTLEDESFFKEMRLSADQKTIRLFSFNANYPVREFKRRELRFIHPVYSVTRKLRSRRA